MKMDFKYFSNQNVGALICSILKSIPPTPTYWVLVMKIAGSEKSQFGMRLGYYLLNHFSSRLVVQACCLLVVQACCLLLSYT